MAKIINCTLYFTKSISDYLAKEYPNLKDFKILTKTLDARGAERGKAPKYSYKVEIIEEGESFENHDESFKKLNKINPKPIIVGMGPAGIFAAIRLMEYGIPSIIIERGEPIGERIKKIVHFWKNGELDTESNISFGEGGAGLYSDGKLTTRSKSPYVDYVMKKFVDFGAPAGTRWMKNPHIGSNNIRKIIIGLSSFLKENGCEIYYKSKMTKLLISDGEITGVIINNKKDIHSNNVILATGHSARDVYEHILEAGVEIKRKDFAVGVRIEHPRVLIDKSQYGQFAGSEHLKTASYRLASHNKRTDRGTFSFCMCPGGYVISSGNEKDGIVINGMSNSKCNSPWSNSALVVSVKSDQDLDSDDLLAGIKFQRDIEKKAYEYSKEHATGKEIPAQNVKDFLKGVKTSKFSWKSSIPSGIISCDLNKILPTFITDHLKEALYSFDKKVKKFISDDAILMAPETRTSAPVQIIRDKETYESNIKGLYPVGEGAGWAGGIISSAVDGINATTSILKKENLL